jgi:hypothetical protein
VKSNNIKRREMAKRIITQLWSEKILEKKEKNVRFKSFFHDISFEKKAKRMESVLLVSN